MLDNSERQYQLICEFKKTLEYLLLHHKMMSDIFAISPGKIVDYANSYADLMLLFSNSGTVELSACPAKKNLVITITKDDVRHHIFTFDLDLLDYLDALGYYNNKV